MKYTLEPKNKLLVIKPLESDSKIGALFIPSTANHGAYRQAVIVAVADDVEPALKLNPGDRVIYDTIGQIDVRVGNQGFSLVSSKNVQSVIHQTHGDE
jgi:co-chaperonin GroES (HSP10)